MKEPRKGKNPSNQKSSSRSPSCRSERQRHATSHFNQNANTSRYSAKPSLRRSILPGLASPSRRRVDPSPRSLMVRGNADLAHTGLALNFASRRDISHLLVLSSSSSSSFVRCRSCPAPLPLALSHTRSRLCSPLITTPHAHIPLHADPTYAHAHDYPTCSVGRLTQSTGT
jgi:hypothetical protein